MGELESGYTKDATILIMTQIRGGTGNKCEQLVQKSSTCCIIVM